MQFDHPFVFESLTSMGGYFLGIKVHHNHGTMVWTVCLCPSCVLMGEGGCTLATG